MAVNTKTTSQKMTHGAVTYRPSYSTYQRQKDEEEKRKAEQDKRNAEAAQQNNSFIGKVKHFFTGGKSDIPMEQGHFPLLDAEAQGIRRYSKDISTYDTQAMYDTIAEEQDEEKRAALLSDYQTNYAGNTGSKQYNPYVKGISNDTEAKQLFGVDSFDQQFVADNAYLFNLLDIADGSKPKAPTKKSSKEYRAAYALYWVNKQEDTTQRAESEERDLRQRVQAAYTVDPNASYEDVLGAIDWESEYPTLYSMREARDNYSQVTLNRGVECSDDYVKALCIAAGQGHKIFDEDDENDSAGAENWYMVNAEDRAGKLAAQDKRQEALQARKVAEWEKEHGVTGEGSPEATQTQDGKAPEAEPPEEELEQADDFGEAPFATNPTPTETGTVAFNDNSPFGALNPEAQTAETEAAASSDNGAPMLDLGNLSTAPQGAGIRTDASGKPMTMGEAQLADEAIDPNSINTDLNDIDLAQTQEMERAETVRQQAAAELGKPFGQRSFDLQMTQAAADVPDAVTGNMDVGVLSQAQQMEADGDEEGARLLLDREARSTIDPKQGYFENYAVTLDEFQNDPEGAKAVLDAVNRAFNSYTPGGKTRMYNRNNTVTTHDMFAAMTNEDGTPSDDMLMVYQIEKAKEAAVMQMFGQASVQEIREVEEQFDAAIDDYSMNIVMGAKQAGKEQMYGQMAEWSARHPVVMGLASIPMNAGAEFMSTVSLIPNVVETAIEGKVDMNTPDAYTHLLVQAQRDGSVANLSGPWKFVVNSMYAAADSVVRVALAQGLGGGVAEVGEAVLSALSGSGAATSTMRSIYEESGNAGMSIVGGLTGGALEAITERMGVDKLTEKWFQTGAINLAFKNGKELFRTLAAQAVGEGLEEVASDVGNTIMNIVATGITGDEYGYTKQYDTLYRQNLASGMAENAAAWQAFSATAWQFCSDLGQDMLAGALSAVPMGGAGAVQGARYTSAAKKSAYSTAMNSYEGLKLYAEDSVNAAADEMAVQEAETQKAQKEHDGAAAELENVRGQIERGEIGFEESLPIVAQATDRVNETQKLLDKAKGALGAARTKLSNAQAEMAKFNRAAMDKAREVTRKYVDENWGGCLTDVRNAMKEDGNADEIMAKYGETPFAEFVNSVLTPFATKEAGTVESEEAQERAVRDMEQADAQTEETDVQTDVQTDTDTEAPVEQTEAAPEQTPVEQTAETETVEATPVEAAEEPKKLTPYQFRSRALADIADIMDVDDETAFIIEGTAAFDEPATRAEANEQLKSVERAYVASTVVLDQLDTQLEENAQMQQDLSAAMANMDVNGEQYAQAAEMMNLLKERFNTLRAGAQELDVRNNALLRLANEVRTKFVNFDLLEQAARIAGAQTEVQETAEQTEAAVEEAPVETVTDETAEVPVEETSEEDAAEVAESNEPITENMTAVERANALLSKRFDTDVVNPQTIQVDAATFQYKTTDAETGTNAEDTLTGEWRNGLAGEMVVYETADGTQYIADGHHRLQLAKKSGVEEINATILRETDGYTKQDARMYATLRNITQEHGNVHDMARFFRESGLSTEDAQRLGISMNKAKAGEAARIANVSDTTWAAYEAGELSDHAVALAGTMQDKLHEDILVKVLSKKENKRMSNAVMDEIAAAVRMTREADNNVQMTLGDFIDLGNYTFEEIGRISAAVKKQLAESATAFKRLLGKTGAKAETVEGTTINEDGTKTARAMAEKAQSMFERYAYDLELSKLVSDQAKELRDGNVTITQAVKAVKDAVIERVANANGNQNESSVLGTAAGVRAEGMGNGDTAGEGRNGSVLEQRAERNGVRAVEGDNGAQSAGRGGIERNARKVTDAKILEEYRKYAGSTYNASTGKRIVSEYKQFVGRLKGNGDKIFNYLRDYINGREIPSDIENEIKKDFVKFYDTFPYDEIGMRKIFEAIDIYNETDDIEGADDMAFDAINNGYLFDYLQRRYDYANRTIDTLAFGDGTFAQKRTAFEENFAESGYRNNQAIYDLAEKTAKGIKRVDVYQSTAGEGRGGVERNAFVQRAENILGRGDRGNLTEDTQTDNAQADSDTVKRTGASLKSLSESLGLTYTTRHLGSGVQRKYNGSGVLGYNEAHSNVSAFPYLTKVGVWAHESGHGLMNALGLNNDADFMNGLNEVWQNSIPQSFKQGYAGANADTQSREAFAEILRTYIEGGEQAARALAGDSVMNTFLKKLPKNQKKALDKCAAEIQAYNGAALGAQIQSKIVTGRQTDYRGAMDRFVDATFDSKYAVMKFDIAAQQRGADLKSVSDRAYTLFSNLSTSRARARAILTEQMRSVDGETVIADSLQDVISPIKKKDMKSFKEYLLLKLDTDRKVVNEIKNRPLKKAADNAYKEWQAAAADVREKQASLQSSPLEEGEARAAGRLDGYTLEELQEREQKARKAADAALDAYDKAMKAVNYSVFPDLTLEQVNGRIRQLETQHSEFAGVQKAVIDWIDTFNMEYIVNQKTTPDAAARYAAMREMYPNYVPAFRSGVDEVDVFASLIDEKNGNGGGGSLEVESSFGKKLKGNSDRAVIDPIESIQKIVMQRVVNTEKVLANRRLAEIADSTPGMGDYLRYLGNTPPTGKVDVLRVVDANGNYKYYQVMDRLLYDELNYSPATAPYGLRTLSKVKAFMSGTMTTYNPAFVLSNMARDFQQAYTTSGRNDPIRFTGEWLKAQGESFFAALSDLVGHEVSSDYYKEFVASGGAEMQSIYKANTFTLTTNKIKQALTLLADATETGTRYMEFKRARKAGETVQGAYRLASDVTTDFSRHGTSKALQLMGKGFLFMNAGLQGLYETQRFYNDGKINHGQFVARMAKMSAIYALLPIIARAAVSAAGEWDDGNDWEEAYANLSADVKRNFLVFPNPLYKKSSRAVFGANMFIKIPKTQSIWAVVGDICGRALIDGDNIGDAALSGLKDANPFGSPIWASLWELATNKAWTGKDIESSYWRESNMPKRYWANDDTSSVAKWIAGKAADMGIENVSPLQVDYYIKQTGGSIGDMLTAGQWEDGANAGEMISNTLDASFNNMIYTIGSRLVTDPATSTDVINTFYTLSNEASSVYKEVKSAKDKRSLKYPKATEERMKAVTKHISGTKTAIGDLYDQIAAVDNDPTLKNATPADRQLKKNELKNKIIALCIDETIWVEEQMDKMR